MRLSSGMEAFLLTMENPDDTAVVVLAERERERDGTDVVSPYGFGGIAGTNHALSSPAFRDAFVSFAASLDYVAAYITQHPAFSLCPGVWEKYFGGSRFLYVMDLNLEKEMMWSRLSKKHRYEIRKQEKSCDGCLVWDIERLCGVLAPLYQETLSRVGASAVYHFSPGTLAQLVKMTGVLTLGMEDDEGIQAISMFTYAGANADYFLNASTEKGRKYSRRLLWVAANELRDKGMMSLSLGGGVQPGDTLDDFKRRFGGECVTGRTLRMVFRKERYGELCRKYCGDNTPGTGYFPPYWQPQ